MSVAMHAGPRSGNPGHPGCRSRPVKTALLLGLTLVATSAGAAATVGTKTRVGGFMIDTTEVTIGQFRRHARVNSLRTRAERDGGGFEYAMGWQQRPGWNWSSPFGRPGTDDEPAVHLTWNEARDYCRRAGGDLPGFDQWRRAAYEETRESPTDGLLRGRIYPYPVGEDPAGMNTSDRDRWPRHAPAGTTRRGVNGLYDMGANVWEWLRDRDGDTALTAGGSWWYGPGKTQVDGVQYKPIDFAAVYIGFRCVYGRDPD